MAIKITFDKILKDAVNNELTYAKYIESNQEYLKTASEYSVDDLTYKIANNPIARKKLQEYYEGDTSVRRFLPDGLKQWLDTPPTERSGVVETLTKTALNTVVNAGAGLLDIVSGIFIPKINTQRLWQETRSLLIEYNNTTNPVKKREIEAKLRTASVFARNPVLAWLSNALPLGVFALGGEVVQTGLMVGSAAHLGAVALNKKIGERKSFKETVYETFSQNPLDVIMVAVPTIKMIRGLVKGQKVYKTAIDTTKRIEGADIKQLESSPFAVSSIISEGIEKAGEMKKEMTESPLGKFTKIKPLKNPEREIAETIIDEYMNKKGEIIRDAKKESSEMPKGEPLTNTEIDILAEIKNKRIPKLEEELTELIEKIEKEDKVKAQKVYKRYKNILENFKHSEPLDIEGFSKYTEKFDKFEDLLKNKKEKVIKQEPEQTIKEEKIVNPNSPTEADYIFDKDFDINKIKNDFIDILNEKAKTKGKFLEGLGVSIEREGFERLMNVLSEYELPYDLYKWLDRNKEALADYLIREKPPTELAEKIRELTDKWYGDLREISDKVHKDLMKQIDTIWELKNIRRNLYEKNPFYKNIGLSIKNISQEILDSIGDYMLRRSDDIKKLHPFVQKMIKDKVKRMTSEAIMKNEDPFEFVKKVTETIDGFLDRQNKIYEFDIDTWNKIAEAIDREVVSKEDLIATFDVIDKYKLDINGIIKNAKNTDEVDGVFAVLNAINKKVLNKEGNYKYMQQQMRAVKFKNIVDNIFNRLNLGKNLKEQIKDMLNKLEERAKNFDDEFEKNVKEQIEKDFYLKFGGKKYDLTNSASYQELVKNILETDKIDLANVIKDESPNLGYYDITMLERLFDKPETLLDKIGLGVIRKLVRAGEHHWNRTRDVALTRLNKAIKIAKKHKIKNTQKIADALLEPELVKELSTPEKKIYRLVKGVYDVYKKAKKIHPDFEPIENYLTRKVLHNYFLVDMLTDTNKVEIWHKDYIKVREKINDLKDLKEKAKTPEEAEKIQEKINKYEENAKDMLAAKEGLEFMIERIIKDAMDKGEITQEEGFAMLSDFKKNGENFTTYAYKLKELPYWLKNRIEAGLKPDRDPVNYYAENILKEKIYNDMKKLGYRLPKNAEPIVVLDYILKETQRISGRSGRFIDFTNRKTIDSIINTFLNKSPKTREQTYRRIKDYDANHDFVKFFMAEKKLDPTVIKRVTNNYYYKVGNVFDMLSEYIEKSHRGLVYRPVAKILNALDPTIEKMGTQTRLFLEELMVDIAGKPTQADKSIIHLLETKGFLSAISDPAIKYFARKSGIKDPEVYYEAGKKFVRGKIFDPITHSSVEINGIQIDRIVPVRIAHTVLNNIKALSYLALLGGNIRSMAQNLTQPLLAFATSSPNIAGIPTLKGIAGITEAYSKVIQDLLDPKKRLKLKRAGAIDEILRLSTEGLSEGFFTKQGIGGKVFRVGMFSMTGSEWINRGVLYEYYKILYADRLKAMGLSDKLIDRLAVNYSNEFNFRFDLLSRPAMLRSITGKTLFHLGTFTYHQVRLVFKMIKEGTPLTGIGIKAIKQMARGDWDGFYKTFNSMNNQKRLGLMRWVVGSLLLNSIMQQVLGYSLSSTLAWRTLDYNPAQSPLVTLATDMYQVMTGNEDPKKLVVLAKRMIPFSIAIQKMGKALQEEDWRYIMANSKELYKDNTLF